MDTNPFVSTFLWDSFPAVIPLVIVQNIIASRVALKRTDVSEERSASMISVKRIGVIGTT
jgi:hypothetical protein